MKHYFDDSLRDLLLALREHPVFSQIQTLDDLAIFMQHHAYGVWDFMSLLKALQHAVAPSGSPWGPNTHTARLRRAINETVLEEESDELPDGSGYASHFEIYLKAMDEIHCPGTQEILDFAMTARTKGWDYAIHQFDVPESAREFMTFTFSVIDTGEPHRIASCFAFGRENIVPMMFRSLITKAGLDKTSCPCFLYYLERHMDVDENRHGPMAVEMVEELCGNQEGLIKEALEVARQSLVARIKFWDAVSEAITRKTNGLPAISEQALTLK